MLPVLAAALFASPQLGWRAGTPEPVLDGNPEWVQLYWKSWENLQAAILEEAEPGPLPARVITQNGAVEFDGSLGVALYARWGWRANPIVDTLSFLFQNVDQDGASSARFTAQGKEGVARGIPIAALAALSVYELTGNKDQLLVHLGGAHRRHDYIRSLYSFMVEPKKEGEKPRVGYRVPPELSALPLPNESTSEVTSEAAGLLLQDAVALAKLHRLRGAPTSATTLDKLANELSKTLASMWNPSELRYRSNEGTPERDSIFPLFGSIGGKAPLAKEALRGLFNPNRFYRRMLFPTVARSDGAYNGTSSQRPLFSYLCLRALIDNGMHKEAGRAAEQMLGSMQAAAGANLNLYGSYGPETRDAAPGASPTSLEAGAITIAGLLEAVMGFHVEAYASKVAWMIRRQDRHGIKSLRFGDNVVTLIFDKGKVDVDCEKSFTLEATYDGTKRSKRFMPGKSVWELSG